MRHCLVTGHQGHMPQSMTDIKLENIYVGSIFRVEEEHDSASSRQDPRTVRLMDRLHFCL